MIGVFGLIVFSALGFGYLAYEANNAAVVTIPPKPQLFCGTVNPAYSEEGEKGRQLFQANCAACHKLYKKAVGPALYKKHTNKHITVDYLFAFVTNEDSLLRAKNEFTIISNTKFEYSFEHKFELTKPEIEYLLIYLE